MLTITCENGGFRLSYAGNPFYPLALDLANIYGLDELLAHEARRALVADGLDFRVVGEVPEAFRALSLELLRQVLYLHVTHCLYPRISTKARAHEEEAPEDFEHYLNGLRNMPLFKHLCHAHILKNHAFAEPVVIASPGPSLDVGLLRRLKGRAHILAIGRALPRLIRGGVVPDFVYVQDTAAHAWRDIFDFEGCPERIDTALIANPAGHIHAYAHKVSRVYKSWNYFPFEKDEMPKLEEIPPSSTSGAFSLAMLFGASEIIFMGNDCGSLEKAPMKYPIRLEEVLSTGQLPKMALDRPIYFLDQTPQGPAWTKSDYIAGLQWLKTRIFTIGRRLGVRFWDNSTTGFLRNTGLVTPLPADFSRPPYEERPLPSYNISFHPEQYLKGRRGRFGMVRRSVANGNPIPPVGLERPFNAVFYDLPEYAAKGFDLDPRHRETVLARLDRIIGQIDHNLAVQW